MGTLGPNAAADQKAQGPCRLRLSSSEQLQESLQGKQFPNNAEVQTHLRGDGCGVFSVISLVRRGAGGAAC